MRQLSFFRNTLFIAIFMLFAVPSANAANEFPVNLGDKAPDFTLVNANGEERSLYELLKKGPVVLSFYRGGWCPYCNEQLQSYQADLESFKELGAQLVAVSPEKPESAQDTAVKNTLEFEVLSDVGNEVARQFGLVWQIPEGKRKGIDKFVTKKTGMSLQEVNGLDTYELPIPATYIIRQDGEVAYLFRNTNYKVRANNEDLIDVLKH